MQRTQDHHSCGRAFRVDSLIVVGQPTAGIFRIFRLHEELSQRANVSAKVGMAGRRHRLRAAEDGKRIAAIQHAQHRQVHQDTVHGPHREGDKAVIAISGIAGDPRITGPRFQKNDAAWRVALGNQTSRQLAVLVIYQRGVQ